MAKLGIDKRTTTSYHPQCNGAIERQHRRIKESLRAKLNNETRSWVDALPLIILGLNNAISNDTNNSAAQATFQRQLSIPGCIFDNIYDLNKYTPPSRTHHTTNFHIPKSLYSCKYIWLRKPGIIKSLDRPYKGPFEVISRNFDENTLTIFYNNAEEVVSMSLVKPAFLLD